jgi:hypothetical protein
MSSSFPAWIAVAVISSSSGLGVVTPLGWSGRQAMLPPPTPLRTVREGFPSYGSSLSFAPFGTRFRYGQLQAVDFAVAGGME